MEKAMLYTHEFLKKIEKGHVVPSLEQSQEVLNQRGKNANKHLVVLFIMCSWYPWKLYSIIS